MKSRKWIAGASLILVLFVGWGWFWLRNHEALSVDDPRHGRAYQPGGELRHPAVLRYVSALPGREGEASFGLVLEAPEGFPGLVFNLTAAEPRLGSTFDQFVEADGFAAARRRWQERDFPEVLIERLARDELARRVLSPVDSSLSQQAEGERLVVGIGFNYAAHRQETASDVDRLAFAKMVAPTGAYEPVSLGPALLPLVDFAQIVDYEVEIAFVLLEDLDLDALPSAQELASRIAYVHANDVSNRRPIIVQGDRGFTVAKSAPGYLPLGPWMVHGGELDLATASGGEEELILSLRVEEDGGDLAGSHRQHGSSREMLRGPEELLHMLGEISDESLRPDAEGSPRGIVVEGPDGGKRLPRGSLVLTGTPHGTAIEAPTGLDKARLFLLGNLSPGGAKLAFAAHCVRRREDMGFLSPGDEVDAFVSELGRQRWEVRP